MGLCASRPEDKYSEPTFTAKEGGQALARDAAAAASVPVAKKGGEDIPVPQKPAAAAPAAPCMACNLKVAEAVCPADELIGNIIDPINGPAAGLPYKVHYLGPPRPPCEGERLATTRALGRIDDPKEDPEITNILQLVSSIFGAPASLCALFDDQRVFISEQEGSVIPRGDFPWRWTLCGWSLAFKNPQILVIPDTHEDARFANNLKVTKPPHVRFYCGAPLVASNGHRLGTLCFADVKPRQFDQASCMIMNNLSELVVRQLEKGIALKAKAKDNNELANTYGQLQRAFDAFEHCVVLLDVTEEGKWRVIYCNAQLQKLTGLGREDAVGKQLQELFEESDGGALPGAGLAQAINDNKSYRVRVARVKRGAVGSACSGSSALTLSFRPASKEHLDEHVMQIGVPAFLPVKSNGADTGAVQQKLYFMTIDQMVPQSSGSSLVSVSSRMSQALSSIGSEIEGLDVGHLLGRGTFGSVYYGQWHGSPVAVKVIESDASKTGPLLEAVLSQQMKHPLIVSTLKYFHRTLKAGGGAASVHDSAASGGHTGHSAVSRASQDIGETPGSAWHQGGSRKHDALSSIDSTGAALGMPGDSGSNVVSGANADSSSTNGWAVVEQHVAAVNAAAGAAHDHGDGAGVMTLHTPASGVAPSRLGGGVGGARASTASSREREWRQTYMVMEYADRGSLQEALDRGWMYLDRTLVARGPNVTAVLATAAEIASALKYLHANQIVHGDLSGWNIMLCSNGATASVGSRGFVAKVGDFGLSRSLDISNEIMTKNYGTLTHQPPETLTHGIVSRATDVYSFGVLMWQMYTGSRPWSGLSHAQVIMQVGNQGARLKWPANTPATLRALGEACMHPDASQRPTMDDVVSRIEALQQELLGGPDGKGPELTTEVEWN